MESGEEEEVELIVSNEGTYCPLLCELPLRWGLPCRHWMYPAFVDVIPIPSSLIHPRWFFDGPDHLTNTWEMSFDPTLPAPTARFSTIHTDQTGSTSVTSRMDTEEVYERHAGDQYRDHGRNMMMKAALYVIEKQKAFRGAAAEDFARAFQKQTVKISEAVKERVERQQILPAQLPPSFKEPNLRKFPNKSGHNRRMTGTEAALAAEADQERLSRKAEKQLEITARYEAELAALEAEPLDHTPKSTSHTQTLSPVIRPQSPIHITSDSEPEFPQNLSQISSVNSERSLPQSPVARHSMLPEPGFSPPPVVFQHSPSPVFRQSGRNRKLTRKAESQKRREAEREEVSEPTRKKVKKSKRVDLTSQLRDILGSDIEF